MENVSSINRLTTNRTTRPIKDKIKTRQTSGRMLAHVWRSLRIVFVFFFSLSFFSDFFSNRSFHLVFAALLHGVNRGSSSDKSPIEQGQNGKSEGN